VPVKRPKKLSDKAASHNPVIFRYLVGDFI
jgi:hypothetical protein